MYPKKRSDSGLRVILHISVRGHAHGPGCTRWFLTFNGAVCSNPSSIENVDYSSGTGNHHRATDRKENKHLSLNRSLLNEYYL